jgi:6-phosphogluconolactonase
VTDRPAGGQPEVRIEADAEAAALAAAERVATVLRQAVAGRGRADWATTGGSTPLAIYRNLAGAPLRDAVPWPSIHVWWGDDRYVVRDHPWSNVLPLDEALVSASARAGLSGTGESGVDVLRGRLPGVALEPGNIHPFPTTRAIADAAGAAACATEYEAELRAAGLPTRAGWPAFDLVLLGIGPDGHLLSVFPGSDAFDRSEWALAIPAPDHVDPHVERVTLHPAIVGAARSVVIVAHGAAKADVIARALDGDEDARVLPARLAVRTGASWILDEAAAAGLLRRR